MYDFDLYETSGKAKLQKRKVGLVASKAWEGNGGWLLMEKGFLLRIIEMF